MNPLCLCSTICSPSMLFIAGGYPQFPHSTKQSELYWPEDPGYPRELKTESENGPDMREAMLNAFARTDRGPVISIYDLLNFSHIQKIKHVRNG